jgi:hypothetical protein
MKATGNGAVSGVILGLVTVFLAQQFGYLDFTVGATILVEFLIAGIAGGFVGAAVGGVLGRRYLAQHPSPELPAAG